MDWCNLCQTNKCTCDIEEIQELKADKEEFKNMLRQISPITFTLINGVYEPRCIFCNEETHTETCKWLQKVGV